MFYLILVALTVFLVVAEGVGINPLTFWNLLPLAIAFIIYLFSKRRGKSLFGAYGFLLGSMLLSGFIHLAWMTDWNGTMSGLSTSALIFLFLPIDSVVAGLKKITYDPKTYGRTLKAIVGNPTMIADVRQHALNRLNSCNYRIVDYPFTKCVTNSFDFQGNKVTQKKKRRSGSLCYSHYMQKKWEEAFDSRLEEANRGKAYAQYNLAHLYRLGNGTNKNQTKAVEYYKLATDQDYGEAQFSLGIMYFQGAGIAKDMEKARYWWERSETSGIASGRVKKALNRIPR